jgi:hypothetical protein
LNSVELVAGVMPRLLRKLAQPPERVADEDDGLHVATISRRIYEGKNQGRILGGREFAVGMELSDAAPHFFNSKDLEVVIHDRLWPDLVVITKPHRGIA